MKPGDTYDLFQPIAMSSVDERTALRSNIAAQSVSGLLYLREFISKEEERTLLEVVNNQCWLTDLKRRVQHYGYKYDYRSRTVRSEMYLGPLPVWIQELASRLVELGISESMPDQVIINEYEPGQGIANHVDCEPCFGDTVISLSLSSICVMTLIKLTTKEKVELVLEPRSIVVIRGESRYQWTHGIVPRIADEIDGERVRRKVRISITFRKVII